jgi:hypothetical protein
MEIHQKAKGFAVGLAFLLAAPLLAGEKVQITGSTSITIPKPNQILEDAKRSRVPDGPSGGADLGGAAIPFSPMNSSASPEVQRRLRETLDRQKNWIFQDPKKMHFDSKTEEFYKGEKGTGLYNHHLMKSEEKGVVERFLQEKKNDRESDTGPEADDRGENRAIDQKPDFMAATLKGNAEEKEAKPKLERGLSLPPALEEKASELFSERSAFQKRLDSSPFDGGALGARDKERLGMTREERDARDAELSKIYQPRLNGSVAPTVGADPVNRAFDSAQQEATPFSVRRSDQLNLGRADSGNPSGRNSPIFSPGVGSASSDLNADLSSRRSSFGEFGSRAPAASTPNPVAAPAQSSRPSFAPAPFILSRPQRKI